jgi:hypothetical protein
MTVSLGRMVAVAAVVTGCATTHHRAAPGASPTTFPTTTTTAVAALQTHNPTVTATPSQALHDGQVIKVIASGFGPGAKVYLSECARRLDASQLGCGEQLAAQPFLVTDSDRTGTTTFTVNVVASSKPYNTTATSRCSSYCVLVASSAGGYAVTPLEFLPS